MADSAPTPSSHTLQSTKRPRNAFLIYRGEKARELKEKASGSSSQERVCSQQISKVLAAQWMKEPEDVRQHFFALAAREKEEHKRLYPDYKYRPRRPRKSDESGDGAAEKPRRRSSTGTQPYPQRKPSVKERPASLLIESGAKAEPEEDDSTLPVGQALTADTTVPPPARCLVEATLDVLPVHARAEMEHSLHSTGVYNSPFPTDPAAFGLSSPHLTLRTSHADQYGGLADWSVPSTSYSSAPTSSSADQMPYPHWPPPPTTEDFMPYPHPNMFNSAILSLDGTMHSLDGQLLTEAQTDGSADVEDLLKQIFGPDTSVQQRFPTLLAAHPPNFSRPMNKVESPEPEPQPQPQPQPQHQPQLQPQPPPAPSPSPATRRRSSTVSASTSPIVKLTSLFRKGHRRSPTLDDWAIVEREAPAPPPPTSRPRNTFTLNGEYTRESLLRLLQEG